MPALGSVEDLNEKRRRTGPFDWRAGGAFVKDRARRVSLGYPLDLPCDVCAAPMVLTNCFRDADGDGGGGIECTRCNQSHGIYGPDANPAKYPIGTHFCTVMNLPPDRASLADWLRVARAALGWGEGDARAR